MRRIIPLIFALCCGATFAFADELFTEGSFEAPLVTERTPREKGGDPSNGGKGPAWITFEHKPDEKGGRLTAGLTKEIARTGGQSLYVEFAKVALSYQSATLQSRLIPISPASPYKVGIWGRLDAKNPIVIGPKIRTCYLKVQIDFFSKDGTESVGESVYSVQPIPSSKNREAVFTPDKWSQFQAEATTPEDAGFLQVTWRWETGSEEGETNGVIFFDDSSVTGPPAANPSATPAPAKVGEVPPDEPGMTSETSPDATPEETSTPASSPSPAASPSPAKPTATPARKSAGADARDTPPVTTMLRVSPETL